MSFYEIRASVVFSMLVRPSHLALALLPSGEAIFGPEVLAFKIKIRDCCKESVLNVQKIRRDLIYSHFY